jgi:hypothetical protein
MIAAQPNGQGNVLAPTPNTAGGVGGPSASPPGGTPKNMQAQRRQRAPNTFAAMQQQGMARPTPAMAATMAQQPPAAPAPAPAAAPPVAMQATVAPQQIAAGQAQVAAAAPNTSGTGRFSYGAGVQALSQPLMNLVMQQLQDPTAGLSEAAQSNFDRLNRGIGREFTDLRENLNENLAARGLDASTIAVSGLSKLGERQAEAQSDLAARTQEQLVRDRAAAIQAAVQSAMGLRGQEADMAESEFTINRDTGELEFRRGLDSSRLALDAELGRGNLDLGRDRLGLERDRFGFDQMRDTRDFDYRVGRDTVDDTFRRDEFDWRRSTDTRDFDYRVGQDAIDNRFRENEFDWRRDTDLRDFDYGVGRDRVSDERFDRTFQRDADWRAEDNEYRDGRDTINDGRWQQTFDQGNRNFTTQNMIGLLQSMGFNNINPGVLNQIMQSLGLPPNSGAAPTPPTAISAPPTPPVSWREEFL